MKIEKERVQVVLTPKEEDLRNDRMHLPPISMINGCLYRIAGVHNDKGLLPESKIPAIKEEVRALIDRECNIDAESSCQYIITDIGDVYEVCMINTNRRYLRKILPSGKGVGPPLYLVGAICQE